VTKKSSCGRDTIANAIALAFATRMEDGRRPGAPR
jgi:hypothetical protein